MALQKAQKVLAFFQSAQGKTFEREIILNSSVTHAEAENRRGTVEFSLPILEEFTNSAGALHGGAISTIIDDLTAIAIWVADPQPRTMVSTDLSTSFLSAATAGEVLRVVTNCEKVGKNMAFASAELFVGERLVATGKHTLYVLGTPIFPEEAT